MCENKNGVTNVVIHMVLEPFATPWPRKCTKYGSCRRSPALCLSTSASCQCLLAGVQTHWRGHCRQPRGRGHCRQPRNKGAQVDLDSLWKSFYLYGSIWKFQCCCLNMGIRAVYPSSALTRRSGDMQFFTQYRCTRRKPYGRVWQKSWPRASKSQLFLIHAKCTTISGRFAGNWTFEAFHWKTRRSSKK